ncbi:glycerophosphoryl diester phosphodiesterase [Beggiatoa alba B18LD]|uniref:glycerophosphodiester phosphodiesterase n=1 Tax=Beggiatoa alba B18LD TaxID=395493 RepID=I3CDL4_9GAMM|nr:glycerophosphodiester phosphodiesterase family protein [Beggiatoa alba]EIJ41707.1 glycerophosphoryl diester phosphodiesterase [Beggiatoa alba B18LD]
MRMTLLLTLGLISQIVLADNEVLYNSETGAVHIPKMQVIGDTTGTLFSVDMQHMTNLNFAVTQVAPINETAARNIQVGVRPFYLIEDMSDSPLKTKLQQCNETPAKKTDFSIGHRGAAMQFPEHTKESYMAAARMGAGIIECDVTFTKDKQLVCRHSQCDLHTTTNILATPLASKCTVPFTPADATTGTPANAMCCTSDITLEEFKTLCGKMDASNPKATTIAEYLGGTANWRTDLYATCGTVMTHAESIELFKKLDVKMTPELKGASVTMPFDGTYTQAQYAQKMIDEYKTAGVPASHVFAQSFNLEDILYWIKNEPEFGQQAVFLDELETMDGLAASTARLPELVAQGVKIVGPPTWMLVTLDAEKNIIPSNYAKKAKELGLDIITWTLERSGLLKTGGGWYYQSINDTINNDGDMMVFLDVLAKQVGIRAIFSDWPATVTYYANCMGL